MALQSSFSILLRTYMGQDQVKKDPAFLCPRICPIPPLPLPPSSLLLATYYLQRTDLQHSKGMTNKADRVYLLYNGFA